MNKKLTVQTEFGDRRCCVLSPEREPEEQLMEVLGFSKGYGITVELSEKYVKVIDYFHGETRGSFTIVSMEDSELPVSLTWTAVE